MNKKPESTGDSIDVWNIHLPDCQGKMDTCHALLSNEEKKRASRFLESQTAKNFILCRGFLRLILGRYLEADPCVLTFEKNENGKPFLANERLSFNISHSRERLLIAITCYRPN